LTRLVYLSDWMWLERAHAHSPAAAGQRCAYGYCLSLARLVLLRTTGVSRVVSLGFLR
jgi:hypothetical protein